MPLSLVITDRYTSMMTALMVPVFLHDPGDWNWYILERELNKGTECSFVTTLRNTLLDPIVDLDCTPRLDASTYTVEGIIQPHFLHE